jgi:hypothetical protein
MLYCSVKSPFIAEIFLLLLTDISDPIKQNDEFLIFLSPCYAIFERYLPKEGKKKIGFLIRHLRDNKMRRKKGADKY